MSSVDLSLGTIELGVLLSTVLYGVMVVQSYTYYRAGFKDPWLVKALVVFLFIVETFHTADLWAFLYKLTVTDFGHFDKLQEGHWTLGISIPTATLITGAVQSFFAIRVYYLSKQLWYPILSCTLCFLQLVGGLANFILSLTTPSGRHMPEYAQEYLWLMASTMFVAAAVDIANTIALCYCLYQSRTEDMVPWTQKVVDRLILWTIETGLLTSILVLTMAITLIALPKDNFVFLFFFCVTTKMYSNSLLASLNNRVRLRASNNHTDFLAMRDEQLSTFKCQPPPLVFASYSGSDQSSFGVDEDGSTLRTVVGTHSGGPSSDSRHSATNGSAV